MTKFKIIMFILAAGVCLASCKEDKEGLIKPTLKLNLDVIAFETDVAGSTTFDVNCNVAWKARVYENWLTVTPESGDGKSIVTVTITVLDNNLLEARESIVEVVAGDLKEQITVSQSKGVTLAFSKPEVELADVIMPRAIAKVTVTSDVDWTLGSKSDWLTVSPLKGLASTQSVELTISAEMNTTPGERGGEFVLKTATREFVCKVRQKKGADRFFGSSDTIYLSDKGSDGKEHYRFFRFTSSAPWTATVDGDWIQMEQTSGVGSLLIKVYPKSENIGSDRIGKITFDNGTSTLDVPVVQGWKGNYWEDGQLKVLNKHSKGKGVPIVVMGDGYDREDLRKGGWWETMGGIMANEIMDADVVRDMWEYLDVYLMMNESPERGVLYPNYPRNRTKFSTYGAEEDQDKCVREAIKSVNDPAMGGVTNQIATEENGLVRIAFLANGPYPGNASNPMARGGIWENGYGYWAVHEFVGHTLCDLPDMYPVDCIFHTDEGFINSMDNEHKSNGLNGRYIDWRPRHPIWETEGFMTWEGDEETGGFIGVKGYRGEYDKAPWFRYDNIGVYTTYYNGMFCENLYGPCPITCMREYYLCFDLGSRMQVYNKILQRAGIPLPQDLYNPDPDDPGYLRSVPAFKEFDKKRVEANPDYPGRLCKDCRLDEGTGSKRFTWTQYCNATGRKIADGDYESFWQRLWPPGGDGSVCE
jgi:hypothetical protein